VTAPPPTPRPHGSAPPTPSMSPTASTCGRTSPTRLRRPCCSTARCCPNPRRPPDPSRCPRRPSRPSPRRTGRLSDRVREQHAAVPALIREGVSLRAIGRRLGLARGTVRRLGRPSDPDELLVGRWMGGTSILDPYKPYLNQRYAEGFTVARRLFEEIRQRGFRARSRSSASTCASCGRPSRTRTRPAASPP
jgi:hypothetical protein